jgi:prenylated cyclic peptide (anacyclamide/piricyclamide family)
MTKKNLKPQQAAPVQREINTTSSEVDTGLMTPHAQKLYWGEKHPNAIFGSPFAGDDAE